MLNVHSKNQDQKILPGFHQSKEFDEKVVAMLTKLSLYREILENMAGLALELNDQDIKLSHNALYGMVELVKEIDSIMFAVHCAQVFVQPPKERWSDLAKEHPLAVN